VLPHCTGEHGGSVVVAGPTTVALASPLVCDLVTGECLAYDGSCLGSTLMSVAMQQQLAAWMAELGQGSAAGWALCYDSPGGDSKSRPSAFQAQCDAHARTLSVAHTEGNGGRTFGGYAEHSWAGDPHYDETASADFLFQLGHAAAKYPPMTRAYQYDNPGTWPRWGVPCLAMDYNDGEVLGAKGYCQANGACPGLPGDFCGGGSGTWGETELEGWYALA
jgi:hypothetical protein